MQQSFSNKQTMRRMLSINNQPKFHFYPQIKVSYIEGTKEMQNRQTTRIKPKVSLSEIPNGSSLNGILSVYYKLYFIMVGLILQMFTQCCRQLLPYAHISQEQQQQERTYLENIVRVAFLILLNDSGMKQSEDQIKLRALLITLVTYFNEVLNISTATIHRVFFQKLSEYFPALELGVIAEGDSYLIAILKNTLTSVVMQHQPWKRSFFQAFSALSVSDLPIISQIISQRFNHHPQEGRRFREDNRNCLLADPLEGIMN